MGFLNKKNTEYLWFPPIFLAAFLLTLSLPSGAKEMAERDVRTAVETWVRYVTADARPEAVIDRMQTHRVDGQATAYIAILQGDGYCLCGADDLVLPVYLYSPHGIFDEKIPDLQYILWEITARTEYLAEAIKDNDPELLPYREELSDRALCWQELIAGSVPSAMKDKAMRAAPTQMALNLTCTWGQGSPYNDQCPVQPVTNDITIAGCHATAMSQIMYYWKWPNTGVGTGSTTYYYFFTPVALTEPLAVDPLVPNLWPWINRLDWAGGNLIMDSYWDSSLYEYAQTTNSGITISDEYLAALKNLFDRMTPADFDVDADFGAATYDWSVLQDIHSDPVDDGDPEVAELCHHVGVAINMEYGLVASGTSSYLIEDGLQDHFRYDMDANMIDRNIEAMIEDIQWLRPIHFRAKGHGWVIYGYNTGVAPTQFLMNMGWSGNEDNWYSCDDAPRDLVIDQRHTLRIAPQGVIRFVGGSFPGDGSPAEPYENIEEALTEAPDHTTLIFKAGSDNTFSAASLVVDKPLILKGKDAVIRRAW